MSARKAPTINEVRADGTVVLTPNGSTEPRTYSIHRSHFDKVTWIKIGSYLGVTWNGVPMHKDLDEIKNLVLAKFNGVPFTHETPQPVPATPTHTPKPEEAPMDNATTEKALRELIKVLGGGVDEETVRKMIKAEVENLAPKVLEIHLPNRPVTTLDGIQHFQFAKVLAHLNMGNHVLMVGPAGTGKSTIAEQAAAALGLEFSSESVNAQTSSAALKGYMSADGRYIGTEFRDRFENGGVFLLDEVDAGNPNVLGVLNSALANGWMAFPDRMVKRHKDFVAIAAGNTYGNGATAEYVGRNPLDKAFTDRFMFMDVAIDESIEDAMVFGTGIDTQLGKRWLKFVRTVRSNVESNGLKIVVSPRGALGGAKMLASGAFTNEEVIAGSILKGAKPEQAEKMLAGASF